MKTIITIAGPTASGKTDVAVSLAEHFSLPIVNADSRQVYRNMDIGTNKGVLTKKDASLSLKERTISAWSIDGSDSDAWLFNIVDPDQPYSIYDFQTDIYSILEQFDIILLVGGSGLYIDSILKSYDLIEYPVDEKQREILNSYSLKELYEVISEIDGGLDVLNAMNNSDKQNPVRIIRAIEKLQAKAEMHDTNHPDINSVILYPQFDREHLYKRIDSRVDTMIEEGLVSEVEQLIANGFGDTQPMNGIGYKEIKEYLDGTYELDEAIELIKTGHRQYASRQITWFEGERRAYQLAKQDFSNLQLIHEFVNEFIEYVD